MSGIAKSTLNFLSISVCGFKNGFVLLARRFREHPVSATFQISILFLIACLLTIFLSTSDGVAHDGAFQSIGNSDGIFFLGHIYETNLEMRSVTISWLIGGCGKYRIAASGTYFPTVCGAPNLPIDVYIDSSPIANFSYDPAVHPKQADGSLIFVEALNQFSTTHMMTLRGTAGLWVRSQDFYYPFDTYNFATAFIVTNPANTSTPAPPILRLTAVDATDSFLPTTHEANATATLDATVFPARSATIRLARTELAKAFTLVLFAVNWALVLAVVYLTIVVAVSPTAAGLEGILFVPLTVILTVPALRGLFVDAPRFGMLLDILGLFMQMALASLCSIVATLRVVPRPHTPT